MKRIEAIKNVMYNVKDEIVVSSCGKISREVYAVKDRPKNFYIQGSMGAALPVGIGLALSTNQKVIVLAGDGEILMGLDSLVLLNKLQRDSNINLELFILDNNKYQSTGGQKTLSDYIDFRMFCFCKVVFCTDSEKDVPRIDIPHNEIKRRFMEAINDS